VEAGDWVLQIDSRQAREVRFRIGGSSLSDTYTVTAGAITEVRLALTATVARPPKTVTPQPGLELYTVREGDTLASIAAAAEMTEADLLERNPQLENAEDIAPGDVIYLRELVAAAPSAPEPVPSPVPEELPAPPPAAEVEPEPDPAAPPVVAPAVLPSDEGGRSWMLPAFLVAVVGLALALVALWRRRSPTPAGDPAVEPTDSPAEAAAAPPASGLARLRQEQEQLDADQVFQVRYELPDEERAAGRQRANYMPPVGTGPATPQSGTTPEPAMPEHATPEPAMSAPVMPTPVSFSPPLTSVPPEVVGEVEEDEDETEATAATPVAQGMSGTTVCVAQTGGGRRCADAVRGTGLTLCPAHDRLARTGGTVVHWESGHTISEVTRAEGSAAG